MAGVGFREVREAGEAVRTFAERLLSLPFGISCLLGAIVAGLAPVVDAVHAVPLITFIGQLVGACLIPAWWYIMRPPKPSWDFLLGRDDVDNQPAPAVCLTVLALALMFAAVNAPAGSASQPPQSGGNGQVGVEPAPPSPTPSPSPTPDVRRPEVTFSWDVLDATCGDLGVARADVTMSQSWDIHRTHWALREKSSGEWYVHGPLKEHEGEPIVSIFVPIPLCNHGYVVRIVECDVAGEADIQRALDPEPDDPLSAVPAGCISLTRSTLSALTVFK